MLDANGISVCYNIIRKRTEIAVPWLYGTLENRGPVAMTHILSLASRYGMPTGLVPSLVEAIGDENSFNPAADWIASRLWDGVDRLPEFCATITPAEGYPHDLRDTLVKRWLLSIAAAAVLPGGFRCRGVLTLQGPQGIGKTSWGRKLITDPRLAAELIKVDHHLDAGNKDSQIIAIEHWIVEIGELESTLKRDVARLKGFITNGTDKIRRPYGREAVETQRRTVFYATVNGSDFLVDPTGNTRFWTISCVRIDYNHEVDMQQVFAQCAVLLQQGEQWWLTAEEEALLERQNAQYRSYSLVHDRISGIIAFDDPASTNVRSMTASEVLLAAGFTHPTNPQAKECASLLREWFGESVRVQGRNKWRVPLHSSVLIEEGSERACLPARSKFD